MSTGSLGVEALGLRAGAGWIVVGGAALFFLSFFLWLGGGSLQEGALTWYSLTSGINAGLQGPINAIVDRRGLPLLAALLFGLLGATSPCQLSTNAAAFAYAVQGGTAPVRVGKAVSGYLIGKLVVYGVLGGAALLLGYQIASTTIPVFELVRKAFGPLMIIMALVLLRLLNPSLLAGHRLSAWLQARVPRSPLPGGFVLGLAFGMAFCPTLFLLFFSITIPMALASSFGIVHPLVFAVGTTIPLLLLAALAALAGQRSSGVLRGFAAADRFIRPAAAVVLLLAGFNDTFVYWLL